MELTEKQREKILSYVKCKKFVGALNLISEAFNKSPEELAAETSARIGEILGEDSIEDTAELVRIGFEGKNPDDLLFAVKLIIDKAKAIREKQKSGKEISSKKPPFHELPEPMTSNFGERQEALSKEVFENTPPFRKWNQWVSENTIPSSQGFAHFAQERVSHLRKKAQSNLDARIPLTEEESNVYYYPKKSVSASVELAQKLSERRGFPHLTEQFACKMILENLDEVGAQEILFASREEDIYLGADAFVKTKQGAWFAIDFTVARSEDIQRKKESREYIKPKNLFEFLVRRGDLKREREEKFEIVRAPVYLPREIYIDAVYRFFLEMKLGNEKSATEIAQSIFKKENRKLKDHLRSDIASVWVA